MASVYFLLGLGLLACLGNWLILSPSLPGLWILSAALLAQSLLTGSLMVRVLFSGLGVGTLLLYLLLSAGAL